MDPLIIIPAYNVENSIGKLLNMMISYRDSLIVINDGSTDNTEEIIRHMKFNYLSNAANKGISYSISRGIKWGKEHGYNEVILMDGDGQHEPRFIPYFKNMLSKEYDYVYGTRFYKNANCPSSKLASNVLVSLLVHEKWNIYIKDIACGFKGFKLYKGIEDNIDVNGGYSLVYDTLFFCLENGYNISNININPIYFPEELWYTRISEISALINALEKFSANAKKLKENINMVKECIISCKDFEVVLDGKKFFAFYLQNRKGYIVQSDIEQLNEWISQ